MVTINKMFPGAPLTIHKLDARSAGWADAGRKKLNSLRTDRI